MAVIDMSVLSNSPVSVCWPVRRGDTSIYLGCVAWVVVIRRSV